MRPGEYAKWLLLSAAQAPMTEAELHQLLAQKARRGNIRAMEILARGMPAPVPASGGAVDPPAEATNPFADVIAMSERRLHGRPPLPGAS
jgi:hypothetical protein